MKSLIGEYDSMAAATTAVRGLESKISVQGIVIADHGPVTARHKSFAVSMTGTREAIEHARSLLHSDSAHR